ncbi:MAG: hypothetical protein NZT92_14050 [Abditibacteriales bacterium]|nr:hypothetical protein [Abditibacteriales bacterium]MDW8366251.1 hypothetical protein [Abditibacteriales bacterium]
MTQAHWQLAKTVAHELVERETDVNEVHKAVTYARVQAEVHPERVGANFFALLETMARDGHYLVRSKRTLDYYCDLRDVCGRHLQNYRTATGERGWELVEILGWVVRFMRYYNTEEGKEELAERQRAPARAPQPPPPPPQPAAPPPRPVTPPAAPAFTGTKRETVTLLTAVKNGKAQVRTEKGEEIPCTGLPAYPPGQPDDECRADVTYEGGKAVRAVFKRWE